VDKYSALKFWVPSKFWVNYCLDDSKILGAFKILVLHIACHSK
jgi:hypothetical protein